MAVRPRTDDAIDETRAVVRPSGGAPLGAIVHVLGARAAPARFRLPSAPAGADPARSPRCVIGAGASADVVIQDPTVSRAHLELSLVPEGVLVTDLKSRNGSFYLGQRFERMVLGFGSVIKLGTVDVRIEADTQSLDSAGIDASAEGYRGLLGVSPPMRRLFAVLKRLEGSLVSVLVEGESGCGKELIARAIHMGSSIAAGPLVVVNCGAVARELVLSELFGHQRGAFTGASADRVGAFELAHEGTLFLDEVGELPLDVQPTLLRALESGEVQPLGRSDSRRVRVRIIAATNRDLAEEVRAGRFREDLYYRLAVVKLSAIPLRDRPEDIPLLAGHFAQAAGLSALPPDVVDTFAKRSWPGNARELRNAVQAYIAIGALPQDGAGAQDELEACFRKLVDVSRPYGDQKDDILNRFSRVYLQMLLKSTNGNQSEASRVSGLDRSYIGKMISRHGIVK